MEGELSDDGDRRPLVWALTTGRVGDDAQVMLAANAVGGIVRQVNLKFNRLRKIPNRFMGATMRAVKNTPDLSGPWPDLVVGAGCRTVPPRLVDQEAVRRQRQVAAHRQAARPAALV